MFLKCYLQAFVTDGKSSKFAGPKSFELAKSPSEASHSAFFFFRSRSLLIQVHKSLTFKMQKNTEVASVTMLITDGFS